MLGCLSWDWLYAEGVAAALCARMMGVTLRVAFAELANAKMRDQEQRRQGLDRESATLQNDVYDGFAVYGVPWNVRRPVSDDGQDRTFAHCG